MATSNFPPCVAYNFDGTTVDDYVPSTDAIIPGSFVFFEVSSGTIKLCGADPALIAGIAEGGLNTGGSPSGVLAIIASGKMPVRKLSGRAVVALSCGTKTLVETDVTVAYGIVNNSGIWSLDTTDTTNTRVVVERIDTVTNTAYVRFLSANLQFDGVLS